MTFTDNGDGTATLAGTPATGPAGRYPITITATNGVSPDATQSFTLTVTAKGPGTQLTGPYQLYCPATQIGDVVLNGATSVATMDPPNPTAGSTFEVKGYQTTVVLPAALAGAAAGLNNGHLSGTAQATINVAGATPPSVSSGTLSFDLTIPSDNQNPVDLVLPTTAADLGQFKATSSGITVTQDAGVSLSIDVPMSNPIALTCTSFPNNTADTQPPPDDSMGTTEPPISQSINPVIAVAGGGAPVGTLTSSTTSCTTVPCTVTLNGSKFGPGENIGLELHSTPVDITPTPAPVADSSGNFSATVTIPAGTSSGNHQIVATGVTTGTTATFAFTVGTATTATTAATTAASSSQLAFTGTGTGTFLMALVGGLLVLFGFGLLALVDAPRRAMSRLAVVRPACARPPGGRARTSRTRRHPARAPIATRRGDLGRRTHSMSAHIGELRSEISRIPSAGSHAVHDAASNGRRRVAHTISWLLGR